MDNDIFTYRDKTEGKVGIGRLPPDLIHTIKEISDEYYKSIPDKNVSTYHTWYANMEPFIKEKVEKVQQNKFWYNLCDKTNKCITINAKEMDELYYSNPQNNLKTINLYGANGNYDIHRDCIFNFNGIKFYRVLIGLTDGNNNIITHFTNLNKGHKINSGDYIVFDFDNTTHQVIKEKEELTPRILLKLHYIVCENCQYSKEYVERVKNMYLYYEFITRYIMQTGTDPKTYYQFFWGVVCQLYMYTYTKYVILLLTGLIVYILRYRYKIKLLYKNTGKLLKYISLSLFSIYLFIVFLYWGRYKLTGIK